MSSAPGSNKPHALFVLPVLKLAGAERVVSELSRRLPAHGFATSVLCLEDERTDLGAELLAAGVPVQGLRLSRRRTIACARAIARRLPVERPLIVNSHLFHANIAARLALYSLPAAARVGVQVISTVQVVERRFRPWQFALDRWTARWARAEICVSKAVARFQQERTGLPADFFHIIESGVDLSKFKPDPERPVARPSAPRVLSVGRLDAQKNFPMLLRAWQSVEKAFPGATLSIAGGGPEAARLSALAKKLFLTNVIFLGFVKDVPALMRSADLYVQPSAWEGFGLTVAEAMACGLPVVVSDADSLPELVTHNRTGLVTPKDNHNMLYQNILSLLNDPVHAAELGAAARTKALERFSAERMANDYARFFGRVLDLRPGSEFLN